MREDKLNFGILIRIFVSLLPILLGMPTIATIICAYTIVMTFITVGTVSTIVSSLCSVAAAMFLSSSLGSGGELYGLMVGMQSVLCAVGCIWGLFRKRDFYKGLILATAGILLPQLIYENSIAHSNGIRLADMLVPSVEEFKAIVTQTFESFPADVTNILEQGGITVEILSEISRSLMIMIIPSVIILSSLVVAYILMWAVASSIRKYPNEKIHSFSKIKLSRICTVLVLILVVILFAGADRGNTVEIAVMANMLIILISLAFFSGLSLMDYYLRKAIPFKLLRMILHAIIILNFFPVYVLAAFVDSFVNFRKLPKTTDSDKEGGGDFETKK